jgi:hypothetical protein
VNDRRTVISGGCANVAVAGIDGAGQSQWFLASVSDDPYDIRTRVICEREPGRLTYVATELQPIADVGMTTRGYVVAEGERGRGVNEAGLGFCWAFVREQDTSSPGEGGFTSGQFSREVLDTCESVEDVLRLLDQSLRDFSGAWFFADATGDFAQVEVGRRAYEVAMRSTPQAGIFAANVNCYQNDAMAPYQTRSGALSDAAAPNGARLRAAHSRLEALPQPPTIVEIAGVLADHEGIETAPADEPWVFPGHGFSICNHGTFGGDSADGARIPMGSVSGEIVDPVTRTLWYCYGWPCGSSPSHGDQLHQEHSWGRFLPFALDQVPTGALTTLTGELTALSVGSLDLGTSIDLGESFTHASIA